MLSGLNLKTLTSRLNRRGGRDRESISFRGRKRRARTEADRPPCPAPAPPPGLTTQVSGLAQEFLLGRSPSRSACRWRRVKTKKRESDRADQMMQTPRPRKSRPPAKRKKPGR